MALPALVSDVAVLPASQRDVSVQTIISSMENIPEDFTLDRSETDTLLNLSRCNIRLEGKLYVLHVTTFYLLYGSCKVLNL